MSRMPQRVEFDLVVRELADKNQDCYSDPTVKNKPEWVITTEKKYNSISGTQVLSELVKYLHDNY